jgi:ferrous iron transport protein A
VVADLPPYAHCENGSHFQDIVVSVTLAEQKAGATIEVVGVDGVVDGIALGLFEMGLVPGTTVTVTRRAPLGDPLEILVRGTRLCLRTAEAGRFRVEAKT